MWPTVSKRIVEYIPSINCDFSYRLGKFRTYWEIEAMYIVTTWPLKSYIGKCLDFLKETYIKLFNTKIIWKRENKNSKINSISNKLYNIFLINFTRVMHLKSLRWYYQFLKSSTSSLAISTLQIPKWDTMDRCLCRYFSYFL